MCESSLKETIGLDVCPLKNSPICMLIIWKMIYIFHMLCYFVHFVFVDMRESSLKRMIGLDLLPISSEESMRCFHGCS